MDVDIRTDDPNSIDAGEIARALSSRNYYVHSVAVNGEVLWMEGESI